MSTPPIAVPGRVANEDVARARYGDRAQVFIEALSWSDPLGDAVVADMVAMGRAAGMRMVMQALEEGIGAVSGAPDSVVELFAQIDARPGWVDSGLLDAGARAYCRHPFAVAMALGTASLVGSYVNGAAVQPMALTRRFTEHGAIRAYETGSWLWASARPGGLERHGPGVAATVRVRLIHAFVRHHILTKAEWDFAELGHPINQADSAYTLTEFSLIPMRAMAQLGIRHTPDERAAIYHLFRYLGHLMGVDERVLPTAEADFVELEEIYHLTGASPDDYSRDLVRELLDTIIPGTLVEQSGRLSPVVSRIARPLCHGLARAFTGDRLSDLLEVRDTRWKHLPALVAPPIGLLGRVQRAVPGEHDRKLRRSLAFIDSSSRATAQRLGIAHDLVDGATGHPAGRDA